ncbi:MAG TPA: hypothetical protein VGI73_11830 [Solirubrobacterales bacterium]
MAALLPGFAAVEVTAGTAAALASTQIPGGAATSLSVAGGSARLVGTQALVAVECEGPRDSLCSGTVSLSSGGQTRTTPFSLYAGSHQRLAVAVGSGFASPGAAAVAVARTAQSYGGFKQSRAIVRFR